MEGFIYEGKEPEAKERLRYLFHNQRIYVSSISPDPGDWNVWTEECIQNANWSGLCQIIAQRGKSDMMPVIYGSHLHESNFHCMMECFACGNIQAMERILPPELAQVNTCHQPFFLAASHILIGLWYKDDAVLEWAIPNAEQFLKKKKSTLLEKSMTAFLLDLAMVIWSKAAKICWQCARVIPEIRNMYWEYGLSAPWLMDSTVWPNFCCRRTLLKCSKCQNTKIFFQNLLCGDRNISNLTCRSGFITQKTWNCSTKFMRLHQPN